jgi:hypothetical protein
MYVIIRFHVKDNVEHIVDVVDSYDDLTHYCDTLLSHDLSLKRVQPLTTNPRVGRCVPIAFNEKHDYYVQYQTMVREPSFL